MRSKGREEKGRDERNKAYNNSDVQLAQNLPILKMVMAAFALVNNDNNNNNHLGISRVTKTNAYFLLTVHYMWRPSGFLLFTQGPSESDPVPF